MVKGQKRLRDAYKELSDYSKPGVFALVNEKDRRVLISVSSNILKSASRIFDELKHNKHGCEQLVADRSLLDLVVLEENSNKILRLQKVDLYASIYSNNNYTFYKPPIYSKYEWYTELKSDYTFEVGIKSSFGTRYIDCYHKTLHEANEHIRKNTIDRSLERILKRNGRL